MNNKFILDACCGGRMFRFDKHHENAVYIDNRTLDKWSVDSRPEFFIEPDMVMDFCDLKFPDKHFKLVVWDPPHLQSLYETSWMAKKYGVLSWDRKDELAKWFSECWRVLDDYGVLIFKRNEYEIPLSEVLELFEQKPLFGHTTGKKGMTKRLCFMKVKH